MRIIVILIAIVLSESSMAQSISKILMEIESNNTTLAALRQQVDAEKTGNRTGIYLANPEVEFHYLWGNGAAGGDRVDFSAQQQFDFPTAYYYKRKMVSGKDTRADIKYKIERKDILLNVQTLYVELVYQNALYSEYSKRLSHARQLAAAYQARFEKGDANILDKNKAQLNLLNAERATDVVDVERKRLLSELSRLNGGKSIDVSELTYLVPDLSDDFNGWYNSVKAKNRMIDYFKQETMLSQDQETLTRSMNLPKLSAGYMSEKIMGEHLQGVMVGISIPLWENKNTVKQVKMQTKAYQQAQDDAEAQFYVRQQSLYEKAKSLDRILNDYKETLLTVNNSELLKKALNSGEISLMNYILELTVYYESVNNVLQTERDLQLVLAELREWEL